MRWRSGPPGSCQAPRATDERSGRLPVSQPSCSLGVRLCLRACDWRNPGRAVRARRARRLDQVQRSAAPSEGPARAPRTAVPIPAGHVGFRAAHAVRAAESSSASKSVSPKRRPRSSLSAASRQTTRTGATATRRRRRARLQRLLVGLRDARRETAVARRRSAGRPDSGADDRSGQRRRANRRPVRQPGRTAARRALHPRLQLGSADGAERLQQQHAARADARSRRHPQRDDPQRAHRRPDAAARIRRRRCAS